MAQQLHFCAVTKSGDYLGGAIAPGMKISSEALFEKAAKLPRVELIKPPTVICKNTVASMQAGMIYGYGGLVDNIVTKIKRRTYKLRRRRAFSSSYRWFG